MKKNMIKILSLIAAGLGFGAKSPTVLEGEASYYAKHYIGKPMANGQPYNPDAFTLACNDLPLGTVVYIEYVSAAGSRRTAHATVTDRGPAERLREKGRIFDLSWALFRHLENPNRGLIQIRVEVLP